MKTADTASTEKALLLVTLGFLEALRLGAIDDDEAFHTIGIPSIVARMADARISDEVADLVGQLDEFDALYRLAGPTGRDTSIRAAMADCVRLLKGLPLKPNRSMPVVKLLE